LTLVLRPRAGSSEGPSERTDRSGGSPQVCCVPAPCPPRSTGIPARDRNSSGPEIPGFLFPGESGSCAVASAAQRSFASHFGSAAAERSGDAALDEVRWDREPAREPGVRSGGRRRLLGDGRSRSQSGVAGPDWERHRTRSPAVIGSTIVSDRRSGPLPPHSQKEGFRGCGVRGSLATLHPHASPPPRRGPR
jgi:hypothetical protein